MIFAIKRIWETSRMDPRSPGVIEWDLQNSLEDQSDLYC